VTLTVKQAFDKMRSKLEVLPEDIVLAIKRRGEIHERLMKDLDVADELELTGSFHRHTKVRPLKDVDFLCPLADTAANRKQYRDKHPQVVLEDFAKSLRKRYGDRVYISRRSVRVDFGSEDTRILSYDIVPAFEAGGGVFEIPDKELGEWIKTNPGIHAEQATKKNKACEDRWKPLIKMIKAWNRKIEVDTGEKAIKPSFLIEVMGLEILHAPLGDFPTELQFAFASLAENVDREWPDPAGFGPGVNEMDEARRDRARTKLLVALAVAEEARRLARTSDRKAILEWKKLFGALLPLEDNDE
jgi:hypothetical protein